jgi:pyruvate/2-oxoacid:ferredoxin oxidoreductase beta subunit
MFTVHGLHGRVTALAAGIHLGNPEMPVICTAGDGSTLSEGINHLIHSVRNNYNITFILHNNQNY